jgi:hypothetical protein
LSILITNCLNDAIKFFCHITSLCILALNKYTVIAISVFGDKAIPQARWNCFATRHVQIRHGKLSPGDGQVDLLGKENTAMSKRYGGKKL